MSYSEEDRLGVLALYPDKGTAETARLTGIPARTVRRWANEASLSAARSLALDEGGALLAKTHDVMRLEMRVLLLEKTVDLLERIDHPHIEYKAAGSEIHKLEHPVATSGDVKNYAAAINQLVDKYRLEMGEVTANTQIVGAMIPLDPKRLSLVLDVMADLDLLPVHAD